MNMKKRVFSGLQPTGRVHLGNYIGAISVWREQQDIYDNIFCIVDLHALTIPEAINVKLFKQRMREVAATYLACGIDPKKSKIFIQSHVKEHAELSWILNCVTPMGWLNRMTQFKSKSEGQASVGTALYDYPVLQAADIMLYDTNLVPVGDDQKQHIELARDIANRFNGMFGDTLLAPETLVREEGARIMGLNDPTIKMSKSDKSKGHAIYLTDDERTIRKAIMSAVTDCGSSVDFENISDGVQNLITIYKVMSGFDTDKVRSDLDGVSYGELKRMVADIVVYELTKIKEKYEHYISHPEIIDAVLAEGAEAVRPIAQEVLERVYKSVGIR